MYETDAIREGMADSRLRGYQIRRPRRYRRSGLKYGSNQPQRKLRLPPPPPVHVSSFMEQLLGPELLPDRAK